MVVKPSDCMANVDSVIHLLELTGTEEDKWAVDKAIQNVKDVQQYGRLIAEMVFLPVFTMAMMILKTAPCTWNMLPK